MQILNDYEVVITSSSELKIVLEDNKYKYIYLNNDIELNEDISISSDRLDFILDGTYNNNRYTLTIKDNNITAANANKKIIIKNINIINANINGVIYSPSSNVVVEYNNITFIGVEVSYLPYGTTRIINSNIQIEATNGIASQEICESNHVEIGGTTQINSSTTNAPLFTYLHTSSPSIKFLPNSRVTISTDTMSFMNGTNRLDFKVMHDAEVNLITGNGFSAYTTHGAKNVLIDERATLNFIEKSHQRIPMWVVFGDFKVNEGANLLVINTYSSTPSDNYNIHFKGSNQKLILNNPNSVVLYSKNANVLYTNNDLTYTFNISRINMWNSSKDIQLAGSIEDLPNYNWYKDKDLINISGTFNKESTSISTHNLTDEELNKLSSIDDFNLNNKKSLSVGVSYINVSPITIASDSIKGYTLSNSDVLIEYDNISKIISSDDSGLFEYQLTDKLSSSSNIKITTNTSTSFIYTTRTIEVPFSGEITLTKANNNIIFEMTPISYNPVILPKKEELILTIIDSRVNTSNWKLYAYLSQVMTSNNGFTLEEAITFKKTDNEEIKLTTNPSLIFTGEANNGTTSVTNITWSKEKGLLLNLDNNPLEINEEYSTKIIWSLEE